MNNGDLTLTFHTFLSLELQSVVAGLGRREP